MSYDRSLMDPKGLLVMMLCTCALSGGSEFKQNPSNVTVVEGRSAVLTCALSNNGTIEWTFDGDIISLNSPLFAITTNDTYSELYIVRADHTQHSGYYRCVSDGDVSTLAKVVVQYLSDDISIDTSLVTANVGGSVSFVCTPPSAEPLPTVRWEKDGTALTHVSLSLDNRTLQLDALMVIGSGLYYCVAENGLGKSVNASTELRVKSAAQDSDGKYTVKIPFDQYCASARSSLSIDCLISPQPNIKMVRWLHNGLALTSGIDGYYLRLNFTLKISSVSARHVGSYCCAVEGSLVAKYCTEVLMNCEERLQVKVLPPYLTPLWSLLLNFSYTNVMLKGGSTPVVSWSKDGIPVQLDRRMSQLANGSVRIQPVNFHSDLGHYTVTSTHISNIVFTTSVTLPATATPPSLQLLASSTLIQLQSSVTLTCSFTSSFYQGFAYRWFLNSSSSPLSSDSRHSIHTTRLNSTLHISNVSTLDTGTYTCAVWEANVSVSINLSLASYLYLLPLTLNQQPTWVCNGTALSLVCPFAGGRGRSNVTWSLNNVLLIDGVGGVSLDQDGRMLIVASLHNENEGVYACNVTDGFTSFYQALPVSLVVPGSIQYIYSTQEAIEGTAVRFDCIVSGTPPPHIIWLQGWVPVGDLNDSSLVELPNGSLLINPVTAKDENTYYCAIQECSTLDIKKFIFKVITANATTSTPSDVSMVNAIVLRAGLAFSGFMLAIAITIFIGVFCCCYRDRVRDRRSTTVQQRAQLAGALRRQASMRASGRKDNGSMLGVVVGHEMTTFTGGRTKATQSAGVGTIATQPPPPLPAAPTPTPTPASNSTAISITSAPLDPDMQVSNFPRTNLQLREVMGEGEFGPVVLGWAYNISPLERSEVAVKVLLSHSAGVPRFQPKAVLLDFASQMQLQNSNICGILGLCTDAEPYYVIYEYLDKGDLKKFLLEAKEGQSIAQKELCNIVAQVADGMAFLYSQRIIHGDLATRNCLVSSDLKVKIADLGIGHDLYKKDYFDNGSQLLPIRWMAPELLTASSTVGPDFSLHSDIWSFGVFCWEVFTFASQPYDDLSDVQVLEQVPLGHTLTSLAKVCPALFHSIMQACWSYKLDERPKFSTLSVAIRKVTIDNWQ